MAHEGKTALHALGFCFCAKSRPFFLRSCCGDRLLAAFVDTNITIDDITHSQDKSILLAKLVSVTTLVSPEIAKSKIMSYAKKLLKKIETAEVQLLLARLLPVTYNKVNAGQDIWPALTAAAGTLGDDVEIAYERTLERGFADLDLGGGSYGEFGVEDGVGLVQDLIQVMAPDVDMGESSVAPDGIFVAEEHVPIRAPPGIDVFGSVGAVVGDRVAPQKKLSIKERKESSRIQALARHVEARERGENVSQQHLRNQHNESQAAYVERMSEAELTARRSQNTEQHSEARAEETDAHRAVRLDIDRRRHTAARRAAGLNFLVATTDPIESENVEPFSIGLLNQVCQYCGALNFKGERKGVGNRSHFSICCNNGKVIPPTRNPTPKYIQGLLDGSDPNSKSFMENIRSYNSALSFASFSTKIDEPQRPINAMPTGPGKYCFKTHGSMYHYIGTARGGSVKQYNSLYFYDAEQALDARTCHPINQSRPDEKKLIPSVLFQLDALIREHNPHARNFATMREKMQEQNRKAAELGVVQPEVRMVILAEGGNGQSGRYNAPTTNEVAILFEADDNGAPIAKRDVVVHEIGGRVQEVSILNKSLDSLTYSFLFLYGEQGFQPGMRHVGPNVTSTNNTVTMKEWAQTMFAIRPGFLPLHYSGRLFQQLVVDVGLRVEQCVINFIKSPAGQRQLRSDDYTSLREFVERRATEQGIRAGKPVVLPSSFVGGPRYMHHQYMDAMTIATNFGNPSLLITFSFNPKCDDLQCLLQPWEKSENRPDLVARVYREQLKELLNDIFVKHIFGEHVAYVYTIEFQKRGLPHAHIIVTLKQRIDDPNFIDEIVSAEIPDPVASPKLYAKVKGLMIHGPCGSENRKAACMGEDGKCRKRFPKDECLETAACVGGYPVYRRRINHIVDIGRNLNPRDSRNVVPYNPYLLAKYNAHINVEVCAGLKSLKYIHKYIYKGFDCASVKLTRVDGGPLGQTLVYDETEFYLNSRYMSGPEAIWRIDNFPLSGRSHKVERLWVHTENMQNVVYVEGQEEEALVCPKISSLMAYFNLNCVDPNARQYYYAEIPCHYVLRAELVCKPNGTVVKEQTWMPRKRGGDKVLGRIYDAPVRQSERFHLRMLLLTIKGATSFEDIRTVNGVVHSTYKGACLALNLLHDDKMWFTTMTEAALYKMPQQLRCLFTNILIFNSVTNPFTLWEAFRSDLIEDFRGERPEVAINMALQEIRRHMNVMGKQLSDFNLPTVRDDLSPRISGEVMYDATEEWQKGVGLYNTLTNEQKCVVSLIIQTVKLSKCSPEIELDSVTKAIFRPHMNIDEIATIGELRGYLTGQIFIEASGGCGKTLALKTLIHLVRGENKSAISCAYTGLAAMLLPAGKTAHSTFMLPRNLFADATSNMKMQTIPAALMKKADIIIWDEAVTAPKSALHIVDKLLRQVMQIDRPFGGKVIVLGGDFRQTLPVVTHGSRSQHIAACIKKSPLWRNFLNVKLTKNMRAHAGAEEFSKFVLSVGDGQLHLEGEALELFGDEAIPIPPECIVKGSLVKAVFGNQIDITNPSYFQKVIVTPTNEDTFRLNDHVLNLIDGVVQEYVSVDSLDRDTCNPEAYPMEYLHSLTPGGMPPHRLRLKVGALIMLVNNMGQDQGLCNGTRFVIRALTEHTIRAEIVSEGWEGTNVIISRILMKKEDELPFKMFRLQFPIRLCFALTINKSQGQSFDMVGVFLPRAVFSHGQLFVAFSRAKCFAGLKVKLYDTYNQGTWKSKKPSASRAEISYTRNVVFHEILTNTGVDRCPIAVPSMEVHPDDSELNILRFPPVRPSSEADVVAMAQHDVYDDIEEFGDQMNSVDLFELFNDWADDCYVDVDEGVEDLMADVVNLVECTDYILDTDGVVANVEALDVHNLESREASVVPSVTVRHDISVEVMDDLSAAFSFIANGTQAQRHRIARKRVDDVATTCPLPLKRHRHNSAPPALVHGPWRDGTMNIPEGPKKWLIDNTYDKGSHAMRAFRNPNRERTPSQPPSPPMVNAQTKKNKFSRHGSESDIETSRDIQRQREYFGPPGYHQQQTTTAPRRPVQPWTREDSCLIVDGDDRRRLYQHPRMTPYASSTRTVNRIGRAASVIFSRSIPENINQNDVKITEVEEGSPDFEENAVALIRNDVEPYDGDTARFKRRSTIIIDRRDTVVVQPMSIFRQFDERVVATDDCSMNLNIGGRESNITTYSSLPISTSSGVSLETFSDGTMRVRDMGTSEGPIPTEAELALGAEQLRVYHNL